MGLSLDFSQYEEKQPTDLTGVQEVTVIDSEIKQAKSGVDYLVLKFSFNRKPDLSTMKWLCIDNTNTTSFQITLDTVLKLISWKIKKPLKETQKLSKEKGTLNNIDKTLLNIVCKVNITKRDFLEIDRIYAFDEKIKEANIKQPAPVLDEELAF